MTAYFSVFPGHSFHTDNREKVREGTKAINKWIFVIYCFIIGLLLIIIVRAHSKVLSTLITVIFHTILYIALSRNAKKNEVLPIIRALRTWNRPILCFKQTCIRRALSFKQIIFQLSEQGCSTPISSSPTL